MSKVFKTDKRKVFPFHVDTHGYRPEPDFHIQVVNEIREQEQESGVDALGKYGALNERINRGSLYHKQENHFNDPITVYFVLDALVNSRPGDYIRPSYLVSYLSEHVPQFYWTVGVVARVLAGFNALCVEHYLDLANPGYVELPDRFDELESHERTIMERRLVPFAMARDSRGKFYVLDPEGGNEARLWLMQARKVWLDMARESMADDKVGEYMKNWGKEFAPVDYFLLHLEGPARSALAYRAQLAGAQTFKRYRLRATDGYTDE